MIKTPTRQDQAQDDRPISRPTTFDESRSLKHFAEIHTLFEAQPSNIR